MKKLLGPLVAFFLSLSSLQAQQTVFGIKAGYNSSSIEVDNGTDYDSKSGLHVGGLAHIHVSKHFAVQPELVFSCQGGEGPNSKLKLSYINLPILAQYMVSNGFRLQTGPQVGFLVSAEQKVGDIIFDVDDVYDNIDLSWVIGGSYLFSSGFGIDLRYNIGVSDIIDGGNTDAMNKVLQGGLFYQFKNNGKRK
jgi:Outer membrane protein beta-barrel domain